MTVEQFKKDYPWYASLEGDALWNQMEEIKRMENANILQPGDGQIVDVVEMDGGYRVHISAGAKRMFEKLFEPSPNTEPPTFSFGIMDMNTGEFTCLKKNEGT